MAVREGGEESEKVAAPAMSGGGGRRPRGHPLLRGGWKRDRYTHGMHPAQMEALRAMCCALIPSLPADADTGRGDPPGGKDLERFYLASAADSTIPDEVNHRNHDQTQQSHMRTVRFFSDEERSTVRSSRSIFPLALGA